MSANQPITIPERPTLHIAWQGVSFTLNECRLACALTLFVRFEDGTPLDDITLGQVVGASSGLKNMNCAGLVNHLRLTKNVYPDVLAKSKPCAKWARDAYNKWLDPEAPPTGWWP